MAGDEAHIFITFLWHMHQPIYLSPREGRSVLPWVRLHAVKDYFDMAAFIEAVPGIKAVFNIVPSLFIQLENYARGSARDPYLDCTLTPASRLSRDEKLFILKNFFTVHKERKIAPSSRYSELWEKRFRQGPHVDEALDDFSAADYLDLQVLFNLAWSGPALKKDAALAPVVEKERNFTEKEKALLLSRQQDLITRILPIYKKLQERGDIEISVSPFYHPLLPLICDTQSAQEALPGAKLPRRRFRHAEDAEAQIRLALQYYAGLFGREAQGMWPPEGALSAKVLELAARQGIRWLATDETILAKSLAAAEDGAGAGSSFPAEKIYSPHRFQAGQGEVAIFFRSKSLSNLISFVYSSWDEEKAASDFFNRLLELKNSLKERPGPHIISIVMDGENAWEYYPRGGEVFLLSVYRKIIDSREFRPTTFSEFLSLHHGRLHHSLKTVAPGSWIDGNFSTWIGEPAKNEAWNDLFDARQALQEWMSGLSPEERQHKAGTIERALHAIYTAEGSDWFWWLRTGDQPENERKFAALQKMHLAEMYRIIGKKIPERLHVSEEEKL